MTTTYRIKWSGRPVPSRPAYFNACIATLVHVKESDASASGRYKNNERDRLSDGHIVRDDGVVVAAYHAETGQVTCNEHAPCGGRIVDKVREYNVGPDELGVSDHLAVYFQWVVCAYEIGDYCGNGDAIALDHAGELHQFNLSHCSCYGPCEDIEEFAGSPGTPVDVALADSDNVHNWFGGSDCEAKVRELLAG